MAVSADDGFSTQLLEAGIRPTVIRLCVLQILAESGSEWLGGEDIFRRMLQRGMGAGLASVYRVIKELEKAQMLQREWERSLGGARAVHRLRRTHSAEGTVRLRCGACNVSIDVIDEALHQGLTRAAQAQGLPAGGPVTVQIACSKTDCTRCEDALSSGTGSGSAARAGVPVRRPVSPRVLPATLAP